MLSIESSVNGAVEPKTIGSQQQEEEEEMEWSVYCVLCGETQDKGIQSRIWSRGNDVPWYTVVWFVVTGLVLPI